MTAADGNAQAENLDRLAAKLHTAADLIRDGYAASSMREVHDVASELLALATADADVPAAIAFADQHIPTLGRTRSEVLGKLAGSSGVCLGRALIDGGRHPIGHVALIRGYVAALDAERAAFDELVKP